jgi:hypothetical protein
MAEESVTTKVQVADEIFEVPAGVAASDAVEFADTATQVSRGLLSSIVRGEQGQADIAWAARFLIDCAQACYHATGSAK